MGKSAFELKRLSFEFLHIRVLIALCVEASGGVRSVFASYLWAAFESIVCVRIGGSGVGVLAAPARILPSSTELGVRSAARPSTNTDRILVAPGLNDFLCRLNIK